MADLTFRRASADDASAIRELTREAYSKWVALIGREPKPMTANYDAAVGEHRFDLLFSEGRLIGLIETVDEEDCLLIENVAVAPAAQGAGIGRRLLAHAEARAERLRKRRLRLYTNQLFSDNIRLYLSVGYVIDREEDLGVGIAVHMSKTLSPPLPEKTLPRSPGADRSRAARRGGW